MALFGLSALSGIDGTARADTHTSSSEPAGYILECPDYHRSDGHYRVIEGETFRATLYTDHNIGPFSRLDATFATTFYGNVTSYVSGRKGCLLPAICFRS